MVVALAHHTGWGLLELSELTCEELIAWHEALKGWFKQQPQ